MTEDHGRSDDFAHEFDLRNTDFQRKFSAIGQFIAPLTPWLDTDFAQAACGNLAIDGARIYQEQPFPAADRISRIDDGSGNVRCSHASLFQRTGDIQYKA